MSGTIAGGKLAAKTNKQRHGEDFFRTIGRKGGVNGHGSDYKGGFASDKVGPDGMTGRERAKKYGAEGGRISRRGPAKDDIDKAEEVLEQESGRD